MTRPDPRPAPRTLTIEIPRPTVEVDVIELAELRAKVRAAELLVELLLLRRRIGRTHVPTKALQRAARVLGLPSR